MNGSGGPVRPRLAVVATHPIQYYAPWFAHLQGREGVRLRVFYLWDSGFNSRLDSGFGTTLRWDIPLLDGYEHEFVVNRSPRPGTESFLGLWNPTLLERVRAFSPDAVLLTAYNYASIASFIARWHRQDAPLLFRGDSHRLVRRTGLVPEFKRLLLVQLFRRFGACLYVGAANREYFRLNRVPDERLFFSPHAVDNDRFFRASAAAQAEAVLWKQKLGIPEGACVILFAGKFVEKKRPLDLLHAFRSAGLERAALLFVGSGPLEKALRVAAGSTPDVFFAPFQNQSQMPRTYAAGNVFVLPSLGASETWGLAVNEAMCMGRAVIVSDHVGCARDLVVPGETGLVFRAGSITELSAALRAAFQDAPKLKRWGDNAKRRIETYSYEAATAGLLTALQFLGVGAHESAAS